MYASYNKSSTLVLGLFLRMAGGGGGPAEDFRTSEQREFARIEQERLDAELARHIAASEGAGQPGHPPAARDGPRSHDAGLLFAPPHHTPDPPWGRDYYEAVPEGYQQLPAGRQPSVVQLPLVQHFFCCISLRCGVLIVAACDAVSAIFQVGCGAPVPPSAPAPVPSPASLTALPAVACSGSGVLADPRGPAGSDAARAGLGGRG
jgi:hypothetical protein